MSVLDRIDEKLMEADKMQMDTLDSKGMKSIAYGKGNLISIRSGHSEVLLTKQEAKFLMISLQRIL